MKRDERLNAAIVLNTESELISSVDYDNTIEGKKCNCR